jgi:alkylhydroperoxidase/carboxymuconolactone decarboxylase family protein YurZ
MEQLKVDSSGDKNTTNKFSSLDSELNKSALTAKTKELIEVSLAVVTGCGSRIESQIWKAANSGASLPQVLVAIEIAVERGGPSATASRSCARDAATKVFGNRMPRASMLAKTRW